MRIYTKASGDSALLKIYPVSQLNMALAKPAPAYITPRTNADTRMYLSVKSIEVGQRGPCTRFKMHDNTHRAVLFLVPHTPKAMFNNSPAVVTVNRMGGGPINLDAIAENTIPAANAALFADTNKAASFLLKSRSLSTA